VKPRSGFHPRDVPLVLNVDASRTGTEALEERLAIKRLGTPDDIAYAVVYLASEQASYITGTVLNVSGGLYT